MTNAKQYTRTELFEMWWTGKEQIPELAKRYGYDPSALSHAFTREFELRKKAKDDRKKAVYLAP